MPTLLMVSGPNGAGKSSLRRIAGLDEDRPVIDPDRLAQDGRLSPIEAGKEAARLARRYIATRQDFARESTLSGKFDADLAELAKRQGFRVELFYIGLKDPEMAITRVAERVASGGHDVPSADVIRRYHRGLKNLGPILGKVDRGCVYDNTHRNYQLLMEIERGRVGVQDSIRLAPWLCRALGVSPSLLASGDLEKLNRAISGAIEKFVRNDLGF